MRGKILIVEDFADWRDLLKGILQREGHEIEAVGSAQAARQYLVETSGLDLAILDIRLVETDECHEEGMRCLLYTSHAADDLLCGDLRGRRIIKKKNTTKQT